MAPRYWAFSLFKVADSSMQNSSSIHSSCKSIKNLIILAQFCLKVYFPTWFEIKHYSKLAHGSKNFFNLFQRIAIFSNQKVVETALKVLQNNKFFAHPENILLGMLGDDDEDL